MATFRRLEDIDLKDKVVLLRADLNVPMKDGRVTDATRIERTVPTIRACIERGAKVAVLSHFGRPKGERRPEMSLQPVAEALASALGTPVAFADDCVGESARAVIAGLPAGGVAMLENLRFHAEEEKNDDAFADQIAALGDVYVNDAFSAAHRAHASTEALARRLPAAAGRLMEAELDALGKALEHPQRPVAAIVGGAKISTKLDVLNHLIERCDMLIVGGGMANTFLHALGTDIGASLAEKDLADTARDIAEKAKTRGCELLLPIDAVVAAKLEPGIESHEIEIDKVGEKDLILDVGPRTIDMLSAKLADARTLVWNGPLGAFEVKPFDAATVALAQEAALLTRSGQLVSVAGGGDTVAALAAANVVGDFSYVSTAGGAFLEWLEGKTLPGVAALEAAAS